MAIKRNDLLFFSHLFDLIRHFDTITMGGCFGGLAAPPPATEDQWGPPEAGGLRAKPPAAGGTGVWGWSPQRLEIAFFCKNNLILCYFDKKIMLLKRGLEIGNANMIKLVA